MASPLRQTVRVRLSRISLVLAVPLALLLWWGTGVLASALPPELPGPVIAPAPSGSTADPATTVPGAGPTDTVVSLPAPSDPDPVVASTPAPAPPVTTVVVPTTASEGARPVAPPVLRSDDDDTDDIDDIEDIDGADDSDDSDDDDGVRDVDG